MRIETVRERVAYAKQQRHEHRDKLRDWEYWTGYIAALNHVTEGLLIEEKEQTNDKN